jgi:hypothetical protein
MKRWGWHRPSPALLIACVALFVALGGTVVAATKKLDGHTIRVKSLPGNRLTLGSVPGNRLKPGTISGASLAPGSVKGEQIDAGSLGPVPSAARADFAETARRAQTATAADHAADATTVNGRSVGCVEGTREFAGACWDLRTSATSVGATEAAAACAGVGGELPQGLDLMMFDELPGIQLALEGEWLNEVWVSSENVYTVYILTPEHLFHARLPTEPHHFRCMTPLIS